MDHSDFVRRYQAGEIAVNIDKDSAGFMYQQSGLMPQNLRAKQAMMRAAAFGGTLLGIVLFFLVEWWVALAVLVVGLYAFPQAQRNAAKGVLLASLESEIVYKVATQGGVLKIRAP